MKPARPPRIATVLPALLPMGGLERLVITQMSEFAARGFDTDIVFINEPQDVSAVLPAGSRSFDLQVKRLRSAVPALVRYLRQERPDAVHATMWPVTSIVAVAHRLARSRSRLVLSDHNPLSLQYSSRGRLHRLVLRASIAATYPLADARVAVSGGVADDLARLSGLCRSRFTVIHNPVPVTGAGTARGTDSPWGDWRGKRIITVGRMKAQKNHALLVRAFQRLLQHVDARLMILGVGELAGTLAEQVAAAGLQDRVLLPGYIQDPTPYYESADLFVLSSDYEGFGNVIVEALAAGLPVVSTDCPGGPAEILQSGRYGRLVPVGDEAALAAAMAQALVEPHDRGFLKSRAQDFTPSVLAAQYIHLLCPTGTPTRQQT